MTLDVALLGTGTMGRGMAGALRRAGLDLRVWNRNADRAAPLADLGASVATSAAEAVTGADVVITMLFDASAVEDVIAEPLDGGLLADAVWLQMTTAGIDGTARLAGLADAAGVTFADAPVLGTKQPAEEGSLQVLWAGPAAARERVAPVLDAMGATVVVADHPGPASALKLVCNAWIASITAAAGQSVALARGLGLDPQLFLDTIAPGPSNAAYLQVKGAQMISGGWDDAAFAVDGVRKDLGLIRAAAAGAGIPTGLVDAVSSRFRTASERGHGGADMSAVVTAYDS